MKSTRSERALALASSAIFEYIQVFYNNQRLHLSLGCVSPGGG